MKFPAMLVVDGVKFTAINAVEPEELDKIKQLCPFGIE